MTDTNMLPLSSIPLDGLITKANWLTNSAGLKGYIFAVSFMDDQGKFSPTLTIRWDDAGVTKVSVVSYPDECDRISVDMSMYPKVDANVLARKCGILETHKLFWRSRSGVVVNATRQIKDCIDYIQARM